VEFGTQVPDKHILASCTKGLQRENYKRSDCVNFFRLHPTKLTETESVPEYKIVQTKHL
jgi:hypothetical protein